MIFLIFFLFFIGCFSPTRSISVSIFKNNTREYTLSNELILALTDEIMKGNFIIEKDSDLTLKGSILDYKKIPIDKEFRMDITIEFELFDKGSFLYKKTLSSSIIYSKDDNEIEERRRLLARICRAIVDELSRAFKEYR